ncbi:MAG: hypothetical protein HN348_13285, partial [Proteobacteria bacterium]|nr:hypothetical protein [Pseudomonadota bacterium]
LFSDDDFGFPPEITDAGVPIATSPPVPEREYEESIGERVLVYSMVAIGLIVVVGVVLFVALM